KVTPKGLSQERFIFNEKLAYPLFILLALNCISLSYSMFLVFSDNSSIVEPQLLGGLQLIWLFNLYNILILIISLYMMVDAPKSDVYHWLTVRKKVKIFELDSYYNTKGLITKISEVGAEIRVNNNQFSLNKIIKIKFPKHNLVIAAIIKDIQFHKSYSQLIVTFSDLSLLEERKLIAILYGNSDQWKSKKTPGELKSLWLMLKVLVRPNFLRKRQ
ncbi:hypothetical protein CY0110_12137, partial [Crocosphaera chwakensis CCY0110]